MGLLKEFREFAVRGNVIDLAVGVVIGGAFGKIVTSLVNDIIMPPLNLITAKSGMNFKEAALKQQFEFPVLSKDGKPVLDAAGNPTTELRDYAYLNYGAFIQSVVDFLIIAVAIFLLIKVINEAKKRLELEAKKDEKAAAKVSEEVKLLTEIRDALVNR